MGLGVGGKGDNKVYQEQLCFQTPVYVLNVDLYCDSSDEICRRKLAFVNVFSNPSLKSELHVFVRNSDEVVRHNWR